MKVGSDVITFEIDETLQHKVHRLSHVLAAALRGLRRVGQDFVGTLAPLQSP